MLDPTSLAVLRTFWQALASDCCCGLVDMVWPAHVPLDALSLFPGVFVCLGVRPSRQDGTHRVCEGKHRFAPQNPKRRVRWTGGLAFIGSSGQTWQGRRLRSFRCADGGVRRGRAPGHGFRLTHTLAAIGQRIFRL